MNLESLETRYFTKTNHPFWECPTCLKGHLLFIEDSLQERETTESINNHDLFCKDPMNLSYIFNCFFQCSNPKCSETIAVIGKSYFDIAFEMPYENDIQNSEQIFVQEYHPQYFEPSLILFKIPENLPRLIASTIKESFRLFFCDVNASMNKLRISLELLLNEFEIQNGTSITLGNKINSHLGNTKLEKYKDALNAVKWLGNAGSHCSDIVIHNDVIDGYRIIKKILNELYLSEDEEVNEKIIRINETKKPLSSQV